MITPPFEAVWPEVQRRLRALLHRRGLDPVSAEDVVQEVALRALSHHVTYVSASDLLRWAGPVACNLHIDLIRQRARLADDPTGSVDRPATDDVAGEVANRIELQRTFRGIARLRPADREAIIAAVAEDEPVPARTRQESVRMAVRRHRARVRLAVVLERLAAVILGWRIVARGKRTAVALALVPVAAIPLAVTLPYGSRGPESYAASAPPLRAVPTAPAALRLAAPGDSRVATSTAPRQRRASRRTAPPVASEHAPRDEIAVRGPGGYGARAGRDERREEDRMVCLTDLPQFGTICPL